MIVNEALTHTKTSPNMPIFRRQLPSRACKINYRLSPSHGRKYRGMSSSTPSWLPQSLLHSPSMPRHRISHYMIKNVMPKLSTFGAHRRLLSTSFLFHHPRRELAAITSAANIPETIYRTTTKNSILNVAHRNFSNDEKTKLDFVVPSSVACPPFSDNSSRAAQTGEISAHDVGMADSSANFPSSEKTSASLRHTYEVPPLDLSQLTTSIPLPLNLRKNTLAVNNGRRSDFTESTTAKHNFSSSKEVTAPNADGRLTPLNLTEPVFSIPPPPRLNKRTSSKIGDNSDGSQSSDQPVSARKASGINMKRLRRKNASSHRDQLDTNIAALQNNAKASSPDPTEEGIVQSELDHLCRQRKQLGSTSPNEKSTISVTGYESQNSNGEDLSGTCVINNEAAAAAMTNDADHIKIHTTLQNEHNSPDRSTPADKHVGSGKKRRRQRKESNLLKLRKESNNLLGHQKMKVLSVNIKGAKRKLKREKSDQVKQSHTGNVRSSLLQKGDKIINNASKKDRNDNKRRITSTINQSCGDQLVKSSRLQKIENNIVGLKKALKSETLDQSKRDVMEADLVKLLKKRNSITFLRSLVHSHLEANGGEAWSKDIGTDLNEMSSSTGDQSALTELKEVSDSLIKFLSSEHELFSLHEENDERGPLVRIRNFKSSGIEYCKSRLTYLRSLVHDYLVSKGGEAWSRDIGRNLSKKLASTGDHSALSELKEVGDSLTTFLASENDLFSLLEEKGKDGQLVRLRNIENQNRIAHLRLIVKKYLLSEGGEAWLGDVNEHLAKELPSTGAQSAPLLDDVLDFLVSESNLFSLLEGENERGPLVRLKNEFIYVQSLIQSYLVSMGGAAGTKDICNQLSAEPSSTGQASALSDLTDISENVLEFCRLSSLFDVYEDSDTSKGRIVVLNDYESLRNENPQEHVGPSQSPANSSSSFFPNGYMRHSVLEESGGNLTQNLESGLLTLPSFNSDLISTQANGTTLGFSGNTSVISTVVFVQELSATSGNMETRASDNLSIGEKLINFEKSLKKAVENANARSGSAFIPLQVEYRERYHGSGKIPSHNRLRRDNSGPMTEKETLAARAVDRVLRPWLMMGLASSASSFDLAEFDSSLPEKIVVSCQVQSYDPYTNKEPESVSEPRHADPTALAINSAIAAIYNSENGCSANFPVPSMAAACVKLAVDRDGAIIFDPTPQEVAKSKFDILYAGTKDNVLMIEFGSRGCASITRSDTKNKIENEDPGVSEIAVVNALRAAHNAVVSIVEHMEKTHLPNTSGSNQLNDRNDLMTDEQVAKYLGLREAGGDLSRSASGVHDANNSFGRESIENAIDEAFSYTWSKLEFSALRLFGYCDYLEVQSQGEVSIHEGQLLPKRTRGRMENFLQAEIGRILEEEFYPNNEDLAEFFQLSTNRNVGGSLLINHIHELIMKRAMAKSAESQFRSDGRRGLNTIRPISAEVPFLPDCVHGSAIFSRGETQGKSFSKVRVRE